MSTTLEPPKARPKSPEIDVHAFEHHWQDEADAAYLYRLLAAAEPDPKKKDVYSRLADVEDRHVVVWSDLLTTHGHPPPKFRPSGRAKLLATLGRWFGPSFLLPMLLEEEGREVKAYLDMHRETPRGAPGGPEALILARESAEHATTLGAIAGKGGEPWHKTSSGGFLRNVVYGFNDGLTANFGLVAGVIGAATVNQHQAVVVAGVAGLIADALSMGSSGYLASKSEREVYEYEISMEKTEVELMPEIERDELAIIYETKGMDRDSAHSLATRVMAEQDPITTGGDNHQKECARRLAALRLRTSTRGSGRKQSIDWLRSAAGTAAAIASPDVLVGGGAADRGLSRPGRCSGLTRPNKRDQRSRINDGGWP